MVSVSWHWTAIHPRRYRSGLENRLNRRGDRVTILEDEGAIIRSNSKDTGPQGHLFQDASSLDVSLTTPQAAPEGIREGPSSIIVKSNKVLNAPYYLLPQTLYGPLVEVLVRLRPKDSPSAEEEPEELEDEDTIMGDAETTTVTEATRTFSEEEMTLSTCFVTRHLAVLSPDEKSRSKPEPAHPLISPAL
ncbi:hypothetical protein M422DRAFT_250037 [Sphaerobolus stellatus SS14]|nr:hypothetical protein M422DRAFT_250037 [Sphaerobolus stellatus SS14]